MSTVTKDIFLRKRYIAKLEVEVVDQKSHMLDYASSFGKICGMFYFIISRLIGFKKVLCYLKFKICEIPGYIIDSVLYEIVLFGIFHNYLWPNVTDVK